MPKVIKHGKNMMHREEITDVDALLNHEGFKRMVIRHLKVLQEHCHNYPRMDKSRKVTITLSLKPLFNDSSESYDRAVFSASVGSPTLPSTEVEFHCAVVNGQPFFNIDDPGNPLQLSFRDVDGTEGGDDDEPVFTDGKSQAVKD
jgi:hypothetical protein